MSEVTALLEANERFAASFDKGDLEIPPARGVLVLTCIDARIDPAKALGLDIGDAHVVRNAGGRASDDAIRSALISSWLLGTREHVVIHHTDCGMQKFTDDALLGKIREEKGVDLDGQSFLTFSDLEGSVRDDVAKLREHPGLPDGVSVSGYVYEVESGRLRPVE
ncbi:MAG TPA: carbonic anhydrase [Actinomycetota bacterium]|nr:carbonic anhydrase [Actinomycetota bacterium]